MSLKHKIQFQFRYFIQAMVTWRLPAWLTCPATRWLVILLIIFFGSAYIIKTASSAADGYKISELEEQTRGLQLDIKKIEVGIAENSSMLSIQKRLAGMDLAIIKDLSYYDATSAQIVAKK